MPSQAKIDTFDNLQRPRGRSGNHRTKTLSRGALALPAAICYINPSVFAYRKFQWSLETEKSSNWTLFPYKTSFKNRPFKKYGNRVSGDAIALLAAIC